MDPDAIAAQLARKKAERAERLSATVNETHQNGAEAAHEPPITRRDEVPLPEEREARPVTPQRRERSMGNPTRLEKDIHRSPPHSSEAEQGLLGSMMIDPRMVIPQAVRQINGDFFYIPAHHTIFLHLVELYNDAGALDFITFTQHLRDVGHLDSVGGPSFITSLFTFVPSAHNYQYYIDIVRDKYTLRQIIAVNTETCRLAYEEQDDVPALLELAHRKMEDVKLALAGSLDDVEGFGFADLLGFDPKTDPDNLIGNRWLCRGFTCLWAGAAGAGKSALEMQLAIYWGLGQPIFGMRPVRPLKSLIVQAENDLGDTGEQLQGVLEGIGKAEGQSLSQVQRQLIEKNVVINRVIASTGNKFCSLLESLVQMHKPDFVWIDPLFAFAGCDLIDAKEAGLFLREGLIPIAVRNRVCIHVIHHVGKPDRDSNAKKGWSDLDFQYLGFGSSEIQNAFRAVNVMLPVSGEEKIFRLILSKRGSRAGAKSTEDEFTNNVYLTHSKEGICWLQVDKPDEQDKPRGGKDHQFQAKFNPDQIASEMSITEGWKTSDLQRHMKAENGMAEKTFYRLWAELKGDQRVKIDQDSKWFLQPKKQSKNAA